MKTVERKELKGNALRTALKNFWRGLWDGSHSTTWYVAGGIVLLIIGLIVAWWLYSSITADSRSKLWVRFDNIGSTDAMKDEGKNNEEQKVAYVVSNIDQMARENAGTVPARAARFLEARLLLARGVEKLGAWLAETNPTAREKLENAPEYLQKAAKTYADLSKESSDVPALQQEALLGAAKAYESLGDLETAKKFYKQLADIKPEAGKPESAHVQQAKAFLADLDNAEKGKDITQFYATVKEKLNSATPK